MQYRSFGKVPEKVSALGYGCMRFPTDAEGNPDRARAIALIRRAYEAGINYFDTAYGYHRGQSEGLVGEALRGIREKVFIATKMPCYMIEQEEDFERIFAEQLARLETDYIDFYLLHTLSLNTWENVVLKFGFLDKLTQLKKEGKIRYVGFSFHDTEEAFYPICDGYDWDFCQIQLNYINTDHQQGLNGLYHAAKKGMGVIIMEPLLGGRLADPPPVAKACLPQGKTPVEWALNYLWDMPEVSLLLSGMSSEEQLEQNLVTAEHSRIGCLSDEEKKAFVAAKKAFDTMAFVPCTKCKYCMPCPFGVDIPEVFAAYNNTAIHKKEEIAAAYAEMSGKASLCKECGKCETLCPQHIAIRQELKKAEAAILAE